MTQVNPGGEQVRRRDILDVSEELLNPLFVNDALSLSYMIKSSRGKTIRGNPMGSKIAALALEPLTKSVNKLGKVNTAKMYCSR